eukprot:1560600-Karenia_brevis.AAC.1
MADFLTPDNMKHVEETYTYDPDFDDSGVARFWNEEHMWDWLMAKRGALRFDFHGSTIFVNAMRSPTEHVDVKRLSVRKLVRAVYEHFGTDQETATASKLKRNYNRGLVRYDGQVIGEWKDDEFVLAGLGIT